ncbi:MAG TPA: class I SAM-dependent methyltransferase [Thermoleophilaceae bacterium]|nr:class I SAM-dependent methyltransferase [Thermoleophilaceae bacterium]
MLAGLSPDLRCTACGTDGSLTLTVAMEDEREVRTGTLTCGSCGFAFGVEEGIAQLMPDPGGVIAREAAGLERFADVMRADGWDRERILRLPDEPNGYWWMQKHAFQRMVEAVDPAPGSRVLDVGSNTCWASNLFARRGASAVALDIALADLQGLRTAEYFLDAGCPHFERVLGSMYDLPFAADSFDYVFCCEVLHHNGTDTLARTFREIHRVLKPGGQMLVINEPLRTLRDLQRHHAEEVAEFEGNENIYFAPTYLRAARKAGFAIELQDPANLLFFMGDLPPPGDGAGRWDALKMQGLRRLQRSGLGRRAYRMYRLLVRGEVALSFIGTKR